MKYWGPHFPDAASGGGGGGGTIVFPALTNATTIDAIRDRALDVIEALVPTMLAGDKFRRYRDEGDGNFEVWAEANPAAAFRRFQVDFDGAQFTPEVSNTDFEERPGHMTTIVAYPHDARAGTKQARDRKKLIDRDADLLEKGIGLYSRQNFSAPYPDAVWIAGDTRRFLGQACDFLIVTGVFNFRRSTA